MIIARSSWATRTMISDSEAQAWAGPGPDLRVLSVQHTMSKTTLFQRTEANIDLFEKELEHLNSCDKTNTSTIVDDKRRLDGWSHST